MQLPIVLLYSFLYGQATTELIIRTIGRAVKITKTIISQLIPVKIC